MHPTAMNSARMFFESYSGVFANKQGAKIVEIGSQNVNGSIREVTPPGFEYLGIDFVHGDGVDMVLESPYSLPLEDNSVDMVVSSSCFEHSEMFWVVFLEIMRILKPDGLFYLNVPSNGPFHRYPVDCWRFYPDSGNALVTWAKRNGINAELLESYTSNQNGGMWNDFVAVFLKDQSFVDKHPNRILNSFQDFTNGLKNPDPNFINVNGTPEDMRK
jgi:SAM-dependent methyltransferase